MKLEDQVVSLELAKKLKELGFKQESYFSWWSYVNDGDEFEQIKLLTDEQYENSDSVKYALGNESFSAYTVAELGEVLLRAKIVIRTYITDWDKKSIKELYVNIDMGREEDKKRFKGYQTMFSGKTEADARAKMLIYLKENKLI